MKKLMLIPLLFLFSQFKMVQPTFETKDIFKVSEIVYYGLDFSKIVITGSTSQFDGAGEVSGQTIRDKYFQGWNNVVINEPNKYNLRAAFRKDYIPFDLSVVEKRNLLRDAQTIFSNTSDRANDLDEAGISKIISEYNCNRKEGIGLVFIMELFDKNSNRGIMNVTLFDIATKKVLITEKMIGTPGGIGVRNYWIKTVFDVLKQVERGEYRRWEIKFGK